MDRWVPSPTREGWSNSNEFGFAWSMTAIMTDPGDYPTGLGLAPEVYFYLALRYFPHSGPDVFNVYPRAGWFHMADAENISVAECNAIMFYVGRAMRVKRISL